MTVTDGYLNNELVNMTANRSTRLKCIRISLLNTLGKMVLACRCYH